MNPVQARIPVHENADLTCRRSLVRFRAFYLKSSRIGRDGMIRATRSFRDLLAEVDRRRSELHEDMLMRYSRPD